MNDIKTTTQLLKEINEIISNNITDEEHLELLRELVSILAFKNMWITYEILKYIKKRYL